MDNFERAFALVVGIEDGYVNDPHDPGGETKYGISKRQYPHLDIANLTLEDAKAIYGSDYWQACRCDAMPWPLALLVFDCAVNQGQPTARVTLQHALGVAQDGLIGEATLTAIDHASPEAAARFMMLRVRRYLADPQAARYGDGWIIRCFTIALSQGA